MPSQFATMIITMAKSMPQEILVKKLKKAIEYYENTINSHPTKEEKDDAYQELSMFCTLININSHPESAEELIKHFQNSRIVNKILTPSAQ